MINFFFVGDMKNDPSSQQSVEYNPLEHRPPEKLKLYDKPISKN